MTVENPTSTPLPVRPRRFDRIEALFAGFVAVVCATLLLDLATCKLTTGHALRGFDYLVLAVVIAYPVMLLVVRPLAKKLALSLTALLVAVLMIEAVLTAGAAMAGRAFPWYIWPPDYRCKLQPHGLANVCPEGVFSTNSRGLRAPEFNPSDSYRILCIGGSTTECLYLDDAKTWPAQLADQLRQRTGRDIWVGNGGRSGLLSFDHYTALANLPEADMVDCWVILCGLNDMGQQFRGSYQQSLRDTWARTFVYRRPGLLSWPRRPLHRNLYLFEQLENLRRRAKLAFKGEDFTAFQDLKAVWVHDLQQRRAQGQVVNELPPLEPFLDEYGRQVQRLIDLAKQRHKRIVFITQPTIWSQQMTPELEKLTLAGEVREGQYLSNARRAEAMDAFNRRLMEVCGNNGVLCCDLAATLPRSTQTFYDDCHFNEPGSAAFAAQLAAQLVEAAVVVAEGEAHP